MSQDLLLDSKINNNELNQLWDGDEYNIPAPLKKQKKGWDAIADTLCQHPQAMPQATIAKESLGVAAPQSKTKGFIPLSDIFNKFKRWITGESEPVDAAGDTPQPSDPIGPPTLEKPGYTSKHNKQKLIGEMKQLFQKINDARDDELDINDKTSTTGQSYLSKLLIEAIKKQKSNKEEGSTISHHKILSNQEMQKKFQKKTHELMEETEKLAKKSHVAKWVNIGLGISIGLGFVASLALAVFAPTVGIPALLTCAEGAAGVASGITTIVKGHYDHKSNLHTAELVQVREERSLSHKRMEQGVHEMTEGMDSASRTMTLLRKLQESEREAARLTS